PGEQLSESVHGDGEQILSTPWPSILALRPIDLDATMVATALDDLSRVVAGDDDRAARELLLEAASVARRGDEHLDRDGDSSTPGRQVSRRSGPPPARSARQSSLRTRSRDRAAPP